MLDTKYTRIQLDSNTLGPLALIKTSKLHRLQACNEPVRPVNPFCELTVPDMRALLLVLVLSMYSFRPLADLLAAELPQCHGLSAGRIEEFIRCKRTVLSRMPLGRYFRVFSD